MKIYLALYSDAGKVRLAHLITVALDARQKRYVFDVADDVDVLVVDDKPPEPHVTYAVVCCRVLKEKCERCHQRYQAHGSQSAFAAFLILREICKKVEERAPLLKNWDEVD